MAGVLLRSFTSDQLNRRPARVRERLKPTNKVVSLEVDEANVAKFSLGRRIVIAFALVCLLVGVPPLRVAPSSP